MGFHLFPLSLKYLTRLLGPIKAFDFFVVLSVFGNKKRTYFSWGEK